jgi:hypothetical protein
MRDDRTVAQGQPGQKKSARPYLKKKKRGLVEWLKW